MTEYINKWSNSVIGYINENNEFICDLKGDWITYNPNVPGNKYRINDRKCTIYLKNKEIKDINISIDIHNSFIENIYITSRKNKDNRILFNTCIDINNTDTHIIEEYIEKLYDIELNVTIL